MSNSNTLDFGFFCGLMNAGNFLHGGATTTLVDLIGSAVISGVSWSGVSVEINVSKFFLTQVSVFLGVCFSLLNLLSFFKHLN